MCYTYIQNECAVVMQCGTAHQDISKQSSVFESNGATDLKADQFDRVYGVSVCMCAPIFSSTYLIHYDLFLL